MSFEKNAKKEILKEICRVKPTYIDFLRNHCDVHKEFWLEKAMEKMPDGESADEYIPLYLERIDKVAAEYKKRWLVSQVCEARAKQILVPEFESCGFEAYVGYWEGAATATVCLSGKIGIDFHFRYSELDRKGCLDQVISDIAELKEVVGRLGDTLIRAGAIMNPSLRRKVKEKRAFSKEASVLKGIKARVKSYVIPAFKSAGIVPSILYLDDMALISACLAPGMWTYFKAPYDDLLNENGFREMASGAIAMRDIVARIGRRKIVSKVQLRLM